MAPPARHTSEDITSKGLRALTTMFWNRTELHNTVPKCSLAADRTKERSQQTPVRWKQWKSLFLQLNLYLPRHILQNSLNDMKLKTKKKV
ncbi:hypothetical protein BTVI_129926 [Pitangus sulphuratus]|nr:hypothetical protein BTVI_129926 [Pitangus sulphuratus]